MVIQMEIIKSGNTPLILVLVKLAKVRPEDLRS